MIGRGRLAVTVAALVFAPLAIISGLDRMAEHKPGMARLVPDAMKAASWRSATRQALAQENAELAGDTATRAVRADPYDPRGVSLLATAQLAAEDVSRAQKAFVAGDGLGHRMPLVQAYFFDVAMASGDAAQAAERLNTLLRVHPSLSTIDYFFGSLEASEAGRAELAARLLSDPEWSQAYLEAFQSNDDVLRTRAGFLAGRGQEIALGCERIGPMLEELARRNYRRDAMQLAQAQCPENATAQSLADPGFEQFGSDSAFGWRRHGRGDVRLSLTGDADKQIEVENRSRAARLVMSQPVALPAGEYRLFASIDGERAGAVIASLDCGQPRSPRGVSASLSRGQLLSAADCPDQVLGIWVRPDSGVLQIDDLRISAVGAESP